MLSWSRSGLLAARLPLRRGSVRTGLRQRRDADAIGWKRACHSVLVECKISRADFLADRDKPFRQKPEFGVGSERFYLVPEGLAPQKKCLPAGVCSKSATARLK